jgi:hypothetical protein
MRNEARREMFRVGGREGTLDARDCRVCHLYIFTRICFGLLRPRRNVPASPSTFQTAKVYVIGGGLLAVSSLAVAAPPLNRRLENHA